MRFAHEHPEDYEERLDQMLDAADLELDRRREEGLCLSCGSASHVTANCEAYPSIRLAPSGSPVAETTGGGGGGAPSCDECGGEGEIEVGPLRSPSDFRMETCEACGGSGREDE